MHFIKTRKIGTASSYVAWKYLKDFTLADTKTKKKTDETREMYFSAWIQEP
jgi:hypothetical protein